MDPSLTALPPQTAQPVGGGLPMAVDALPDSTAQPSFDPALQFAGARTGFAFRQGPQGLGYYRDDGAARARSAGFATAAAGDQTDGETAAGTQAIAYAPEPNIVKPAAARSTDAQHGGIDWPWHCTRGTNGCEFGILHEAPFVCPTPRHVHRLTAARDRVLDTGTSLPAPEAGEAGWVGMRTVADLRRALGVGAPRDRDSLYRPIERAPRKFNPLKIPRALQARFVSRSFKLLVLVCRFVTVANDIAGSQSDALSALNQIGTCHRVHSCLHS